MNFVGRMLYYRLLAGIVLMVISAVVRIAFFSSIGPSFLASPAESAASGAVHEAASDPWSKQGAAATTTLTPDSGDGARASRSSRERLARMRAEMDASSGDSSASTETVPVDEPWHDPDRRFDH